MTNGPLIVQSDKTVLLEVAHSQAQQARVALASFAELERAPEHIHTYRLTSLGLWNAAAAGMDAEQVVDTLIGLSKYPIPPTLLLDISDTMSRYGRLRLRNHPAHGLVLHGDDAALLTEVSRAPKVAAILGVAIDEHTFAVPGSERGHVKQELLALGWPAEDEAGYVDGESHPMVLLEEGWQLRDYQRDAVTAFHHGGSGVVVLPCGAGKTIVGAATMAATSTTTLILVTGTLAARQWREELLARTSLQPTDIGEYTGAKKEIRPVTIATYQILTMRRKGVQPHLDLLDARDWGLIIYDEVHLLPAPMFRITAAIQARRRLGLTATLVREDGRAGEVFSLIGPKRYDAPWRELEMQGWIAPVRCVEVRLDLPKAERMEYATAEPEHRYRIAATTSAKIDVAAQLLDAHPEAHVLIIGQYLSQLAQVGKALDIPVITGDTPIAERERLFAAFRSGEIPRLVVSKVANFSIDLPEADVAIQISGSFGSRQEEAQRLGRILRPKKDRRTAIFYSLVTRDTVDADFAVNRQRFLTEQGYHYDLVDASGLAAILSE